MNRLPKQLRPIRFENPRRQKAGAVLTRYATLPVREQGFRRILVNEPEHPYIDAWWPQGHIIGWEHTFTHQVRDFLCAIRDGKAPSPSFDDGLQVQRVLAAVEESARNRSVVTGVAGFAGVSHAEATTGYPTLQAS